MEYADLLDLAADRDRLCRAADLRARPSRQANTPRPSAVSPNPSTRSSARRSNTSGRTRTTASSSSRSATTRPSGPPGPSRPSGPTGASRRCKSKVLRAVVRHPPPGDWFLRVRPNARRQGGLLHVEEGRRRPWWASSPVTPWWRTTTGPMEIKNWTTGEVCHIEFKPRGWEGQQRVPGHGQDSRRGRRACASAWAASGTRSCTRA